MGSSAIKIVAAVLVVLAIILVGFAYHLSRKYASQAQIQRQTQQAAQIKAKAQVVVATQSLAADQPISRDSVRLVPVEVAPPQYFSNVDDVVNRVPMVDIDAGTPIVPRFFRQISILARDIPPGDRAVSLKIDDVISVGGFIKPGDIVDVLLYLRGNQNEKVKTQARLLLRNAKVLAYQDTIVEPPKDLQNKQKTQRPKHEHTAVLAIPEKDITRVMLGASLGDLRLALLGTEDASKLKQQQLAAAGTAAAPAALPVKQETKKPENPVLARIRAQQPITAAELAQLAPPKRKGPPRPRVVIYRGDKLQHVYP